MCVNHTVYVILIKMMCALKQYIIFVVVVVTDATAAAAAVWLAQRESGWNISATSCLFMLFLFRETCFPLFLITFIPHRCCPISNYSTCSIGTSVMNTYIIQKKWNALIMHLEHWTHSQTLIPFEAGVKISICLTRRWLVINQKLQFRY